MTHMVHTWSIMYLNFTSRIYEIDMVGWGMCKLQQFDAIRSSNDQFRLIREVLSCETGQIPNGFSTSTGSFSFGSFMVFLKMADPSYPWVFKIEMVFFWG